ncbi:MAG TPA: pectinesterase family protein, partial [Ferruginibacter sp.]|nr:pectinesterase family protein [Ferruginibacter sp.]
VFIRCELPKAIASEGWNNWGNAENGKTTFYAEYKNSGEGSGMSKRAGWTKVLSDEDAKEYELEKIFSTHNPLLPAETDWYKPAALNPFQWPGTKEMRKD